MILEKETTSWIDWCHENGLINDKILEFTIKKTWLNKKYCFFNFFSGSAGSHTSRNSFNLGLFTVSKGYIRHSCKRLVPRATGCNLIGSPVIPNGLCWGLLCVFLLYKDLQSWTLWWTIWNDEKVELKSNCSENFFKVFPPKLLIRSWLTGSYYWCPMKGFCIRI